MALQWVRGFRTVPGYGVGNPAEVFDWTNDPGEDAAFLTWLDDNYSASHVFTIDRTGPSPVLVHALSSNPSVPTYTVPLDIGWWGHSSGLDGTASIPAVLDQAGLWVSDQHGRPFDLNDLLA